MENIVVTFVHERETKNAHRFQEVDGKGKALDMSDAIVGTIYLKKAIIGDKAPAKLRATFEIEMPKAASKKPAPAKTEAKASTTVKKPAAAPAKSAKVTVKKAPAAKAA